MDDIEKNNISLSLERFPKDSGMFPYNSFSLKSLKYVQQCHKLSEQKKIGKKREFSYNNVSWERSPRLSGILPLNVARIRQLFENIVNNLS